MGRPLRDRLRAALLLLRDPARWSAERYRRLNAMHWAALQPRTWRTRPSVEGAPEAERGGGRPQASRG